jgi:hypothetical protein
VSGKLTSNPTIIEQHRRQTAFAVQDACAVGHGHREAGLADTSHYARLVWYGVGHGHLQGWERLCSTQPLIWHSMHGFRDLTIEDCMHRQRQEVHWKADHDSFSSHAKALYIYTRLGRNCRNTLGENPVVNTYKILSGQSEAITFTNALTT